VSHNSRMISMMGNVTDTWGESKLVKGMYLEQKKRRGRIINCSGQSHQRGTTTAVDLNQPGVYSVELGKMA
jgi:hypothetical protein